MPIYPNKHQTQKDKLSPLALDPTSQLDVLIVTLLAWMAHKLVSAASGYLRISRRATVPGRKQWGFLKLPVTGADFLAALVASCLRGAFLPVDL
ncbi:Unknown protein [Striga hermonthica]|uniref:Uncharacterized protein n=1 Tax=Striga hermonthica TaxID=68872 RepID=A0A9N7NF67_STRHE|nr:Unknown protein [Striga hermonthica]